MGGVVAVEMAQRLHAQGEQIALLALFDGRIPSPGESFPDEDAEAVSLVERYFGISFGPMKSLAQLPKDEQLVLILEKAKSAGLVPAELDVHQAGRFMEVLRSDLRATDAYALKRYSGRITFFKASDTLTGPAVDPTMGWGDWADGGVEVHMVPGNHANMMYQPHVGALAAALTACLKLARSPTDEQETGKIDQ